jgi:hypothetical protein
LIFKNIIDFFLAQLFRHHGPSGILARTNTAGAAVALVIASLGLFIIIFFVSD